MNLDLVIAAGIFAFLGLVLALASTPRRGKSDRDLAELSARLQQLTEGHVLAQHQIGERLQAQERTIGQALNDRLEKVAQTVSASLQQSQEKQTLELQQLRERLARIDEAQKNLANLSMQVDGLREIFVDKRARGAFGEIQLKDLIEKVLPPSAYRLQATINETLRVDCLLDLPNPPGPICVDAKFPLEPFHALRDATDDAAHRQASSQFGTAIRKHIQDISTKYIVPGETAESALMFLPSEAIYAELHANFPDLVEQSYRSRVFIVSPTTLWAMLNTIRAVLQDVEMREQAGLIQQEVQKMLEDVARLDKRVSNLQRHFQQAQDDMEGIRTSTGKVVRSSEKIISLELEDDDRDGMLERPPGSGA